MSETTTVQIPGDIYVACLAAYNNGVLHGRWIDASADVDEMQEQIDEMLAESPEKNAEEYAIHDYDDFPNMGEYPGLDTIAAVVELIDDYDDVAWAALSYTSDVDDAKQFCEDHHYTLTEHNPEQELGYMLADEMLDIPDNIRRYFDYEAFGRDCMHDYNCVEYNGAMYLSVYS